ncbi:hypothetical protein CNEONATNEC26_01825 [Clostridium neonatale]|nr:hypothetical protein CNEONATNEC26_01825 [Clostridium neonatale]
MLSPIHCRSLLVKFHFLLSKKCVSKVSEYLLFILSINVKRQLNAKLTEHCFNASSSLLPIPAVDSINTSLNSPLLIEKINSVITKSFSVLILTISVVTIKSISFINNLLSRISPLLTTFCNDSNTICSFVNLLFIKLLLFLFSFICLRLSLYFFYMNILY